MKKVFNLGIIILTLAVMIILLTGCGSAKQEKNIVENNNIQEISKENENDKFLVNQELRDAYGFAQEIENGQYKIVALKNDGTILDITKLGTIEYETLDFSNSKIYMQRENSFYEIDLNKGNGIYDVNKLLTYEMDKPNYYKNMGVYEEKIYFNKDQKSLMEYDIANDSVKKVINEEDIINFYLNKEKGVIYYIQRGPQVSFKEYNIDTKEIKTLDTASSETMGTRTYYYNMGIVNANAEAIIYSKEEKTGEVRDTNYYLYNTRTEENTQINDTFEAGVYSEGRLYYSATSGGDIMYPNYELRVLENGTFQTIMKEQENSFVKFYDLGNGKIQAVMNWGQDISTLGEQAYTIDKQTLEVEKTNNRFSLVYLIQEHDKKIINITKKEGIENITVEEAEKLIENKWGKLITEESEEPKQEGELTVVGGYADMKVKDTDGLEYYVFSYYSKPSDGHLSHIQTILISLDGKKYKMKFTGVNFQDGDTVSEFDEEGNFN